MTFSESILEAADTIDRLNAHMEFGDKSTWNATELRNVARAVEEEARELEEIVGQLSMDMFNIWYSELDPENGPLGNGHRELARKLVQLGWRRGEPASGSKIPDTDPGEKALVDDLRHHLLGALKQCPTDERAKDWLEGYARGLIVDMGWRKGDSR
jgi:hypothetical protein